MQPGRSCPLHYRYPPEQLLDELQPADSDVVYIVGGLYGNVEALREILNMRHAEMALGRSVRLVFNGDFNWFNVAPDDFRLINEIVLEHTALLGNVEYEIADPSSGAGCGCAYPDDVGDLVVERSNRIIARLHATALQFPDISRRLLGLPRFVGMQFQALKVVVLHGDPESLAGWGLSFGNLRRPDHQSQLADWFRCSGADLFASTHTCLPALKSLHVDGNLRLIANNGSAGMGNLQRDSRGLITRIAANSLPHPAALYGVSMDAVRVEAVPVAFDQEAWRNRFLGNWAEGSDAHASYFLRICQGTDLRIDDALLLEVPASE